jgi:hypothetical protein
MSRAAAGLRKTHIRCRNIRVGYHAPYEQPRYSIGSVSAPTGTPSSHPYISASPPHFPAKSPSTSRYVMLQRGQMLSMVMHSELARQCKELETYLLLPNRVLCTRRCFQLFKIEFAFGVGWSRIRSRRGSAWIVVIGRPELTVVRLMDVSISKVTLPVLPPSAFGALAL